MKPFQSRSECEETCCVNFTPPLRGTSGMLKLQEPMPAPGDLLLKPKPKKHPRPKDVKN